MAPATFECIVCSKETKGIIKCGCCSAVAYYCENCFHNVHATVMFHTPQIWQGSMFVPYQGRHQAFFKRLNHCCSTSYVKNLCYIDIKGIQHGVSVQFCKCEKEAVTVLRFGMWPATPESPNVLFDISIMELCASLQLESHLPVKSFCEALASMKHYQIFDTKKIKDIYRVLIGDCANVYRYHRTAFSNGAHIMFDLVPDACPACFTEEVNKIICVDGNFGLVHKISAGKGQGLNNARHAKNSFFFCQDDVDLFVDTYHTPRQKQECSSFQAGNILRSKVKNSKLDVTGIFGSVCKHDFPLKFTNLRHGERLAYAVFFLNNIKGKAIFMYDIACILSKHLQTNNPTLLDQFKLTVPVFHSYAHNAECQLEFGSKNTLSCGLADGEGTERLWAYLRRFSGASKLMSLDNRHDLIVDALMHYGEKIQWKICDRIYSRYQKALSVKEQATVELAKLQNDKDCTTDGIENILKQRRRHGNGSSNTFSIEEEYCSLLEEKQALLVSADDNHEQTYERIERNLEKLERKLKISRWNLQEERCQLFLKSFKQKKSNILLKELEHVNNEKRYLNSLIKKYADGQDIAIRLGKQMKKTQEKLAKLLKEFNLYSGRNFDVSDVENLVTSNSVCSSDYFQVYMSKLRAEEEIQNSIMEMQSVISWIVYNDLQLKVKISEIEVEQSNHSNRSKIYFLLLQKLKFEHMHSVATSLFSAIIYVPEFDSAVTNLVFKSFEQKELISEEETQELFAVVDMFDSENQCESDDEIDVFIEETTEIND